MFGSDAKLKACQGKTEMTTFDKREEAFENLFAHDEEMRFRAISHRNKALAAWASGLMAKTSEDADAYQQQILNFGLEHGGEEAIAQRICQDLEAAGEPVSSIRVRAEMDKLMTEAVVHVKSA